MPIYSEKDRDRSYLSMSKGESDYDRQSDASSRAPVDSKISKASKSKYDKLLEIEAKYTNTMKE